MRVDSKRRVTDFPPAGLNTDGVPTGGWWNYSGIQREVYLKKLDTVDFRKVLVRPVLPCGTCDATIQARINLKNVTDAGQRVTITGKFGSQNLRLGTKTIGPDGITEFADNITSATRACGRRATRTSTTSASPCASAARRSGATSSRAGSARSRSPTAA